MKIYIGNLSPDSTEQNLRDLVTRTHQEGGTVSVNPEDTLLTAYGRMRGADVSQLPVLEGDRLVGILDESDILAGVEGSDADRQARFKAPVRSAMTSALHTVQADQPLDALLPIFERDEVAIVLDGREFLGLITRVDLINHLRRS